MVHYSLIYFNARGRAEPARLLFALAGVEYEDVRVDYGKEWPALKPKTPFGQLPILDIDGVQLAQSKAIVRYLGQEFHMAGNNNVEAAKADMLVDSVEDVNMNVRPVVDREKDPEKKKELFHKVRAEYIDPFLKRCEHFLTETRTGYFINNQITFADIFLFDALEKWSKRQHDILDNYPKLKQFTKKIACEPRIKEWIEKRPVTEI